jgi:fructose-1,6-bisphosphatase I
MNAVISPLDLDSVVRGPVGNRLEPEIGLIVGSIAAAGIELATALRYGSLGSGRSFGQSLDVAANDIFLAEFASTPIRAVLSASADELIQVDASATFAVAITPLDGSGNTSANAPLGSIFSVVRARSPGDRAAAFLRPSRSQICAAGFLMYGPATVMALSLGRGTDVFVLGSDNSFVRTHASVAIPTGTREFAINVADYRHWDPSVRIYIDDLLDGADGPRGEDYNMQWTTSVVAEVYRILLHGGILLFPSDSRDGHRSGRLRLLYEARPMAFLVEQAGGAAVDTMTPVLDRVPQDLHERCSLALGSRDNVDRFVEYSTAPQFTGERSPLFARRGLFRT